jgi:hypothetical protein
MGFIRQFLALGEQMPMANITYRLSALCWMFTIYYVIVNVKVKQMDVIIHKPVGYKFYFVHEGDTVDSYKLTKQSLFITCWYQHCHSRCP